MYFLANRIKSLTLILVFVPNVCQSRILQTPTDKQQDQRVFLNAIGDKVQSRLEENILCNQIKSAFTLTWLKFVENPKKARHHKILGTRNGAKGANNFNNFQVFSRIQFMHYIKKFNK